MSATVTHTNDGKLPQNITYFVKALRRAGVSVGTAQLADCIKAVQAVGFTKRDDFFVTLRACLITRPEHLSVFGQVFALFWRDPEFLEKMITNLLPVINAPAVKEKPKPANQRAGDALTDGLGGKAPVNQKERDEIVVDAAFSFSASEVLKSMDFEAMTNAQIIEAQMAIKRLRLPVPKLASRRNQAASAGQRVDMRAAFHKARRTGGEVFKLPVRKPKPKPPELVVLCDISGSMSTYSQMMMHFIHTVSQRQGLDWAQVHAFTLGTRLSNISRALDVKDPDAALTTIGSLVRDWDGGTLLGACLRDFNYNWSRRTLGSGATVLLISDGLERDDTGQLSREMQRLKRNARQVIWLNPLLRYDGFKPLASGIKAIMPHVDIFRSCHSLNSLSELGDALST